MTLDLLQLEEIADKATVALVKAFMRKYKKIRLTVFDRFRFKFNNRFNIKVTREDEHTLKYIIRSGFLFFCRREFVITEYVGAEAA